MPQPFWSEPLDRIFARLQSTPRGLDDATARRRLQSEGPNVLRPPRRRALLIEFLACFRSPLVLLLLAASAVTAYLHDVTSSVIIAFIVILSVALDFVQEHRAGNAAERLRRSVALRATVVRNGTPVELPAARLVPGDVVVLASGDLIPADGRVIEARDFFVNQAFLTGESFPVEKHATDAPVESTPGAAANAVFMGTAVISGSARMLIVDTAAKTQLGQIGRSLARETPPTAFERGTAAFGMLILRLTLILVLFVLLANVLLHRPLLDAFLFAVALAVGLTPELLPMVISVTLARGALRMARKHVIVKRLSAVQDLGAIDVLCTDKTGTLTEGRIRLEKHLDAAGRDSRRVLELAYVNSHFETGLRSPLDEAILRHETVDVSGWRKIDEVPFDFERRRVSVLVERDASRLLIVKGAPEDVLRLCTHYDSGTAETLVPLDTAARERAESLFRDLGREGFRALGIAWRRVAPDHAHAVVNDETQLVFSGYAAFLDPPKASARHALASLTRNGMTIKIVTGDNDFVTRHVCHELGIAVTAVLSGSEIEHLTDEALRARVEQANVFTRVTPPQKVRILRALKAGGHIVGFLGDGINDASALHAADAGISVAGAVDVAREAADLILLQQDLNVLRDGVREGRRAFVNVMKYIMMGTSSNFGNMFSMAGATLIVPFLPLLPVQVLLNNLLYDLSELALPFDRVDEDALSRPCRWDMAFVQRSMLMLGPVSSLFDFLTFFLLLAVFHAGEALFHTGWFVESVASQVLVIFIIRTRHHPFASRPDSRVTTLALIVAAIALVLPMLPLSSYLGFVPLPLLLYVALFATVAAYLFAAEAAKRLFYAKALHEHGIRPDLR